MDNEMNNAKKEYLESKVDMLSKEADEAMEKLCDFDNELTEEDIQSIKATLRADIDAKFEL